MTEQSHIHGAATADSTPREYLKFGAITAAIVGLSLWLTLPGWELAEWMGKFMAVFFLVFAGFKLLDLKVFAYTYMGYDLIAKRSKAYAYSYPFIELALGLLFLLDLIPAARNLFTILLMSVGAAGVYKELARKSHIKCACLGRYVRLPLTTISLTEDMAMGLMAVSLLVMG